MDRKIYEIKKQQWINQYPLKDLMSPGHWKFWRGSIESCLFSKYVKLSQHLISTLKWIMKIAGVKYALDNKHKFKSRFKIIWYFQMENYFQLFAIIKLLLTYFYNLEEKKISLINYNRNHIRGTNSRNRWNLSISTKNIDCISNSYLIIFKNGNFLWKRNCIFD